MNHRLSQTTRRPFWWVGSLLFVLFLIVAGNVAAQADSGRGQAPAISSPSSDALLCRFGVNALENPNDVDLPSLRAGWYMNFVATGNPPRPGGMEYMPVIRLASSNTTEGYTYSPSGTALLNVIATNPNAKWMIGNEPDSPYQDNVKPDVYARAYHELYHLIKQADPTAQIIAGSIVQATEIRLLYLDMILNSYYEQFGEPLPADGWSIHNYILNEVSCDYDPNNCWGADIPPGVNRGFGEVWGIKDNDRVDIFINRIVRFRQWLSQRGYGGQPLYVTEYGVLPPADILDENGEDFSPDRVNAFMAGTYDYMLTAVDPEWGNPNDGYRLVQKWSWYSTTGTFYNGALFDPDTYRRTEIGDFFASYTADINDEVDFYPHRIGVVPPVPFSQGEPVTLTLRATVANGGNLVGPSTVTVRFYDAHPESGGTQIGSDQVISLAGCGDHQEVHVLWTNVPAGVHDVFVRVVPAETETVTDNNVDSGRILVGTHRSLFPIVRRGLLPPEE